MLPRSLEELCERLGIPVPSTEEGISAAVDQGIQLLKTDSISGYTAVYRVSSSDNPWQAKPYIRPKVQRSLGSFDTKEMAAAAVLFWAIGMLDTPLTPDKQRSKRHDGRRALGVCSSTHRERDPCEATRTQQGRDGQQQRRQQRRQRRRCRRNSRRLLCYCMSCACVSASTSVRQHQHQSLCQCQQP